tara:strand:- start:431 stop:598 length:168 start_codon:yes stop_codon:yes gene_type:complete
MSKESDTSITVLGAIRIYEKLLFLGKITIEGAAHQRLRKLRLRRKIHKYFPKVQR